MEQVDPKLLALALPAAYFVQVGVDIVKGIIGDSTHRRWVLPIVGVLLGWLFVAALQLYAGVPKTPEMVGGVILAGLLAYQLAAMSTSLHKNVRERGRQDRVQRVRDAGSPREAA